MKKTVTLILLTITLTLSSTFASRYAFHLIPDELKAGANAVYRTDEMLFIVHGPTKATKKRKVAITMLNETAENYRYPEIYYGKFEKVNYIRASVYDENGNLVNVLRSSDILDVSAITGGAFYSDDRVKIIRFPLMKYPYTIEYEYETSLSGLLSYPTWVFQRSRYASVERSGVQYVIPNSVEVKFRESLLAIRVDSIPQKDKILYTWQMEDIPASRTNAYTFNPHVYPRLFATPLEFEIGGFKGSTKTWKDFGNWSWKMIEGRDKLPDNEIKRIQELVKDAENEREKIKRIYEYMQSRTRYVFIALGIGGWQPMTATEVSQKGFGDCKALTNYTMALLNAVGIKSYYTLVKSGSNQNINPNFVSQQFDHVILCVPQPNDTIWLECTSQILPFNYLSDFTSDRYALLITEDGGKIARTPAFSKGENIVRREGTIKINHISSITGADLRSYSYGTFFGDMQGVFTHQSEEGIKRYLNKNLNIHTFDVDKASFEVEKSEKPSAVLSFQLNIRNFAVQSTNRMFFSPTISKRDYIVNEPFRIRVFDSVVEMDSILYVVPFNYQVEHLPENRVIENKFGRFEYNLKALGDRIQFFRSFELNKGIYSKEEFEDFHSFINSIATIDRERIVLKQKGA